MELYEIGEIIWAKIRGYPWWPAIVYEIDNKDNKISRREQRDKICSWFYR